jgi:UDP-N-acetylmuramoylalanine--D-glutamate ligase
MLEKLKNKKVLLVGFEATNRAFFEHLKKVNGVHIGIADSNKGLDVPKDIDSHLGDNYLKNVSDYDVIVRSPGVRYWPELFSVQNKVTTATQLFFEEVHELTKAKIIGITGTKGKSTTSTLIHKTLESAGKISFLVGNIDLQDWDTINKITDDSFIVYEMSSYMLADFTERPDIAVFLNAQTSHIDWHGTYELYVNSKGQITAFQNESDTFIFNAIFPELVQISERTQATAIPFKHMSTMHHDGNWFYDGKDELFETDKVKIPGMHNRDNVLAVLSVAKILEIKSSIVLEVVKEFEGLRHRLQFVGTFKGIDFYDDAIASNPDATIAALHTFKDRFGTLILGGKDTGFDFGPLAHLVTTYEIPTIVSLPGARKTIIGALEHAGYEGKIVEVESIKDAVAACYANTPEDKVAILSTATQSFDMFKNYKDQGDQFQKLVIGLSSSTDSES